MEPLSDRIDLLGIQVVVGVPMMRQEALVRAQTTIRVCAGAMIAIGLILAILFSHHSTRPIRNLLEQSKQTHSAVENEPENAYRYIGNVIRNLEMTASQFAHKVEDMKAVLRHNRFDRLIESYTGDCLADQRQFVEDIGYSNARLLVIAPQGETAAEVTTLTSLKKLLSQTLTPACFVHVVSPQLLAAIVPAEMSEDALMDRLEQFIEKARQSNACAITIAVSPVFPDGGSLADVFWHTRQYAADCRQAGILFCPADVTCKGEGVGFSQYQLLYHALLSGDMASIRPILSEIDAASTAASALEHRQIAYTMSEIMTVAERKLGFVEASRDQDEERKTAQRALSAWTERAEHLCQQIETRRDERNASLKAQLQAYVEEEYADSQLCAASLASAFHISPKYMAVLFKEQTGISYSEYLESIRLEQASKLLRESRLSVQEIAERVGFASLNTFYKAFKRRYALSPTAWRDNERAAY